MSYTLKVKTNTGTKSFSGVENHYRQSDGSLKLIYSNGVNESLLAHEFSDFHVTEVSSVNESSAGFVPICD